MVYCSFAYKSGDVTSSKIHLEYHSFAFSHHFFFKIIIYISLKFGRDRGHLLSPAFYQ